jgi:type 1 glutamine amidotransferase
MAHFKHFLLFALCLISLSAFAQKKRIKVLIIDGFSNHDWQQTTKMVKQILGESKLFDISVSTAPGNPNDSIAWKNWDPAFNQFDVVIQNTNNIQNTELKWPLKVQRSLESYVKNGGGLYILHSANNAFPDWEEYNKMIGLGWRPKSYGYALEIDSQRNVKRIPPGEGQGTFHGNRSDLYITILNRNPINKGYPDVWKTPDVELYQYARGPAENLTVLSYAFEPVSQKKWPVEWVVNYGKGKVYVSSMGHLWKGDTYPLGYRCIGFQTTMIRVTEWLGSGKVTYPVPSNFPTASAISIRPE